MSCKIRLVTYNIRKGKGADGRQNGSVDAIGAALAELKPDVVLCQEVFHSAHSLNQASIIQSKLLGEATGLMAHYGCNRVRRRGQFGNAILSRFAAGQVVNHDVTTNLLERRGVLYARLEINGGPLHVFNAHLGLNQPQRLQQIRRIDAIVRATCSPGEAVLLAGDFNDWTRRVDREVTQTMNFDNALAGVAGKAALTWHVKRPVFNLDRVYTRHLKLRRAQRLGGDPWTELSDHFPLMAELEYAP